ncbi:MAG: CBS domain-containing protein, partial [Deltaproteobacteria bacterium]|nr:CBS domain-containing protein [Deltaproteobacteria bacterium]
MLVKNWMNQTVISLDVTDSIQTANQLFIKNRIRSLPVLENGKLVGIVSDRDLKKVLVSEDLGMDHNEIVYLNSAIKVKEIMTEDPVTVSPYVTVDEVAQKMFINKISGLPVVDKEGELVGIITQGDIFKLLISLTGIEKKGVQMAMQLKDELDSIKEIVDILRSYQGRVVSMLTSSKD